MNQKKNENKATNCNFELKYSVIVPVYNASKTIKKCINSIRNSSLKEIEIICVNDASTDNSLKILQNIADKDSRLKIINFSSNSGVACARNAGLAAAKGILIGFVDSDDYIDESHIEEIYEKMQKEKSDINLISFKFIKPDKIIFFPDLSKFIAKYGSSTQTMKEVDKLTMLDDYCWRLSIRKSFWEKYRCTFPEKIKGSEDQCFWKPLELMAERVSFLENYGYNYVRNPESITKQEMSSFETVKGIDELMRRLPSEYHLRLMEKCFKRICDFQMKNQHLQNKLKREYIKRIYKKAKELNQTNYEFAEYNYKIGPFKISKNNKSKSISIFNFPFLKKHFA